MFQQQVRIVISFMILLDGLLVIVWGYLAEYLKWIESGYVFRLDPVLLTGMILFVMFVNSFVIGRAGFYSDQRPPSLLSVAVRLGVVVATDFSILLIALYSLQIFDVSRLFFLIWAGGLYVSFLLTRLLVNSYMQYWLSKGFNSTRVVIAGCDRRARRVYRAFQRQLSWGHMVIGYLRPDAGPDATNGDAAEEDAMDDLELLGTMDEFERVLHDHSVDQVVFVLPREGRIREHLALCEELGISYRLVPSLFDPDDPLPITVERVQDIPTLSRTRIRINATGLMYKVILDYSLGLVGFGLMCVMYPFVGLAIKLDSPGPVLFSQPRVGQNRRIFPCFKFRTMYVDAEERKGELASQNLMDGRMFKMENDPRVTRVGRFLRKTSLDEFPQFLNVLRGEMSIVGTRPPTPEEVEGYEHWHQRRISMKPGITGLWQISGRNKITDFDEVVKLDLRYIDNWRFLDDLVIIWKTVIVVLRRKGAL